jgi:hypothetical protein
MLRTSLALAVVLMLWTPFDAHATCKQVKAEAWPGSDLASSTPDIPGADLGTRLQRPDYGDCSTFMNSSTTPRSVSEIRPGPSGVRHSDFASRRSN